MGSWKGTDFASKFHDYRRIALYDPMKSVWVPKHLERWLAQDLSELQENTYFVIFQSSVGASLDVIWRKVAPLIGYE